MAKTIARTNLKAVAAESQNCSGSPPPLKSRRFLHAGRCRRFSARPLVGMTSWVSTVEMISAREHDSPRARRWGGLHRDRHALPPLSASVHLTAGAIVRRFGARNEGFVRGRALPGRVQKCACPVVCRRCKRIGELYTLATGIRFRASAPLKPEYVEMSKMHPAQIGGAR